MRPPVLAALVTVLLGCGGSGSAPPSPVPAPRSDPAPPNTALPADLPERLEIEYRQRAANGDDVVLKLTPAGARYGWARGSARVALRYQLPPEALASVYTALRHEGFDRIDTVPDEAVMDGTALRLSFGAERYSASAMARHAPAPANAEAYARCLAAVEAVLPTGRSDVVVEVRWDPSMAEQSAALDVDVGEDLVGVQLPPSSDAGERLELHLARARPLELQLRHGSPTPSAITRTLQAGSDRGVEVVFDAERGEASPRILAPEP